jgi:hypothetical protein
VIYPAGNVAPAPGIEVGRKLAPWTVRSSGRLNYRTGAVATWPLGLIQLGINQAQDPKVSQVLSLSERSGSGSDLAAWLDSTRDEPGSRSKSIAGFESFGTVRER